MSLFKTFSTDEKLEINGVPIQPAGPNDDGTIPTFFVSRVGGQNHQFTRIREQVMRPFMRDVDAGILDPKRQFQLNVEIFVKANLKGWQNVYNEENQPIQFNEKNALQLLMALPDLYQELAFQATRIQNYQAAQSEVAEKNS